MATGGQLGVSRNNIVGNGWGIIAFSLPAETLPHNAIVKAQCAHLELGP